VLAFSVPVASPVRTGRFSALTMPLVTVPCRPSGEPIATTCSPGARSAELPRVALVRPLTPLAWITARSVTGSRPTMLAVAVLPSLSVTEMLAATRGGVRHDVVVGEDQAVGREHDAGALTAALGRGDLDRDHARQHRGSDRLDRAVGGRRAGLVARALQRGAAADG
jgi:hypothetical protein